MFEVQNKLFGTPWGPKTRPVPAFQWPYVSKSVEKPHRTSKNFLTSFYIETGILNLASTGYMVHYITCATKAVPNSVSQDQYNISS